MKQIRKPYSRPTLDIVDIQVENQLLAGSEDLPDSYDINLSSEEGDGTDALGKEYGDYDLWD